MNIETLLVEVKKIIEHQRELEILKGERFNIFSILQFERKETKTHSAFLGELLNPEGMHSMGSLFLSLFLKTIKKKKNVDKIKQFKFDADSTTLALEKYIGQVDLENKTGGYIDILLTDKNGAHIIIENKIDAIDQESQLERYNNYKNANKCIYYLSLDDDHEPSDISKGSLQQNIDYHLISYRSHILLWLNKCMKASADQPILRESIKQYIILIKKLTNQLTNKTMQKEIIDLIKNNYEESLTISSNIETAVLETIKLFLDEMGVLIKNALGENWIVKIDDNLGKDYSGLSISHSSWNGIIIRLAGEKKIHKNSSDYGIVAHENKWSRNEINSELSHITLLKNFQNSPYYPYYQHIFTLNNDGELKELFDEEKRKNKVKDYAQKLIDLAKVCEVPLSGIKYYPKNGST